MGSVHNIGEGKYKTPTEIASATGLSRIDVINNCMKWGLEIYQGRIDFQAFKDCLQAEDDTR